VPFSGYAVFSSGVNTLVIDPDVTTGSTASAGYHAPSTEYQEMRRRQLEALFSTANRDTDLPDSSGGPGLDVYPNPFTASARIEFDLDEPGDVVIEVFDMLGRRVEVVAEQKLTVTTGILEWEALNMPAGSYIVRLTSYRGMQSRIARIAR
jgi:hypothetical protein